MQAQLIGKTIAHGKNTYRVDSMGNWSVLMWGWWSNGGSRPSWRWGSIPTDKVPDDVKRMGN